MLTHQTTHPQIIQLAQLGQRDRATHVDFEEGLLLAKIFGRRGRPQIISVRKLDARMVSKYRLLLCQINRKQNNAVYVLGDLGVPHALHFSWLESTWSTSYY